PVPARRHRGADRGVHRFQCFHPSSGLVSRTRAQTKTPRRLPRRFQSTVCAGSRRLDYVGGLWAFLALNDLEFHAIALGQRLEAVPLDGAEVNEDVGAAFTRDETVPL